MLFVVIYSNLLPLLFSLFYLCLPKFLYLKKETKYFSTNDNWKAKYEYFVKTYFHSSLKKNETKYNGFSQPVIHNNNNNNNNNNNDNNNNLEFLNKRKNPKYGTPD